MPITPSGPKTPGLLTDVVNPLNLPSYPTVVSHGPVSHISTGRCEDGSDVSIASPTLVHSAVLKGNGRMKAISPVRVQVELKDTAEPATSTF